MVGLATLWTGLPCVCAIISSAVPPVVAAGDPRAIHLPARHRFTPPPFLVQSLDAHVAAKRRAVSGKLGRAWGKRFANIPALNEKAAAATTTSLEPPVRTKAAGSESVPLYSSVGGLQDEVEITVGGTTITVIADAGSTRLWVPSNDCSTCSGAGMTLTGLLGNTTGGKNCGQDLGYGAGNVKACDAITNVTIGDKTVKNFAMSSAYDIMGGIVDSGAYMSGVMGLLNDGVNNLICFPQALYNAGLISTPTIGLYLTINDAEGSELTLGDPKLSRHINTSKKVSAVQPDQSRFAYGGIVDSVSVNGKTYSNGKFATIFDSGDPEITLPREWAPALVKAVYGNSAEPNGDYWMVPCSFRGPSNNAFIFGGVSFAMDPKDWTLPKFGTDGNICFAAIKQGDGAALGNPFLRNVYTVFHLDSRQTDFYAVKR